MYSERVMLIGYLSYFLSKVVTRHRMKISLSLSTDVYCNVIRWEKAQKETSETKKNARSLKLF